MFRGDDKVFFQAGSPGAEGKDLAFETEVSLEPGRNILSVIARHEKDITSLSSERDQLLQLLATKFSNGAGKSMKERERKLAVEDRLRRVEESLKRAKAALKSARRERLE